MIVRRPPLRCHQAGPAPAASGGGARLQCSLIYLNQVENDELVFDRASCVVGADGAVQLELQVCEAIWRSGTAATPARRRAR